MLCELVITGLTMFRVIREHFLGKEMVSRSGRGLQGSGRGLQGSGCGLQGSGGEGMAGAKVMWWQGGWHSTVAAGK